MNTNDYSSLKELHEVCFSKNIPFVSFCLPNQSAITTFIQFNSKPEVLNTLMDLEQKKGFLVFPFEVSNQHPAFLLKPTIVVHSSIVDAKIIEALKDVTLFLNDTLSPKPSYESTLQDSFLSQVNRVKHEIKQGIVKKIVLSRVHIKKTDASFNKTDFFIKLCKKNRHSFHYILQMPQIGCWIGASPEPLFLMKEKMIETVSLAATQPLNGTPVESVVWNAKEQNEQAFVTEYIENQLYDLGITNYRLYGPSTVETGNLIHLKSIFKINQSDISNIGDFIEAIHPTPAVCGMPKQEALKFVNQNEKHQREYYSGFLGPIDFNENVNLYVNLRCMQVFDKEVAIYAGAGITADSIAEHEWDETNHKLKTLLSVFGDKT